MVILWTFCPRFVGNRNGFSQRQSCKKIKSFSRLCCRFLRMGRSIIIEENVQEYFNSRFASKPYSFGVLIGKVLYLFLSLIFAHSCSFSAAFKEWYSSKNTNDIVLLVVHCFVPKLLSEKQLFCQNRRPVLISGTETSNKDQCSLEDNEH